MLRLVFLLLMLPACLHGDTALPAVNLPESADRVEVERLIGRTASLPVQRRVEIISKYLLGRRYHPDSRDRIKKQGGRPVKKTEAANAEPMPVQFLRTSLTYLDCMTYVEHVLAMAASTRPAYHEEFLCRLLDIMFNTSAPVLMNHHRRHFTSSWGDENERQGYLVNVARNHPLAERRVLFLNRVGNNRTFYVEDRFMIATQPQIIWYFPVNTVLGHRVPLVSGDVIAMVTDKEGLDVTHMAFFIEHSRKKWLRHASLKLNRVVDQDFEQYLRDGKHIKGLMVFRPVLRAAPPARFKFIAIPPR